MTISPSKMTHRFQIHFDGLANCSQEHNTDLTQQVVTASRETLEHGSTLGTNTIILQNDLTNRVLSKISAQLNRQKKQQTGGDRSYFRVLLRDLTVHEAAVSTLVLNNCLIQRVTLSPLDYSNPEQQTIEISYSFESFELSFNRSELAV